MILCTAKGKKPIIYAYSIRRRRFFFSLSLALCSLFKARERVCPSDICKKKINDDDNN